MKSKSPKYDFLVYRHQKHLNGWRQQVNSPGEIAFILNIHHALNNWINEITTQNPDLCATEEDLIKI